MPKPRLTPKQRTLIAEVKGLMSSLYLDPDVLSPESSKVASSLPISF
jgi:hypothetical protein